MSNPSIPVVLTSPPWVPVRKRPKLALPTLPPLPDRIVWFDEHEQKVWADPSFGSLGAVGVDRDKFAPLSQEERDRQILELIASRGILPIYAGRYLSLEAIKVALEKADRLFVEHYNLAHVGLAKYGLEVLDHLLALISRAPQTAMTCFLRIDSLRVAAALVTNYATYADEWYARFPHSAARVLLPPALTGNAKDSAHALRMVRALIEKGHRQELFSHANELGVDAAQELDALLAPAPLPAKPPSLPSFVDLTTLPVPTLKESNERLAPEHLERFVQLLACLPLDAARSAVLTVRDACDSASLGDLARALVDRWSAADAPGKEKWVLVAAALVGDDLVTHRLAESVATWAEQGKHPRVAAGVEALASVGSDVALMRLARFAEKSKVKNLKKKAEAALAAYREAHGVTADELADRIVTDLGFDERGELTLSYGPRSFRVVFDETLKVSLRDGEKPLRSLPKVSAADDLQLAERAQAAWDAIKKETKPIVETQIRRLERALSQARTWSFEAFERYHLRHPLMQHFARRLVWGAFDGSGVLAQSFRIAEDGTFASVSDEPVDVSRSHAIGIVHPLALGRELTSRWGDVLGDYQIVQPFPQLARETFELDEAERKAQKLTRFVGVAVEGSRFYALKHRGWEFFDYDIGKRLSAGRSATLSTEPGLYFLASKPENQTLGEIELGGGGSFGALSSIETSELVRDVEMLRK